MDQIHLRLTATYHEPSRGLPGHPGEVAIMANGYTIYSIFTDETPGAQPGAVSDLILRTLWEHFAGHR
jgi:hypothetical protein